MGYVSLLFFPPPPAFFPLLLFCLVFFFGKKRIQLLIVTTGFFSAGLVTLPAAAFASITTDMSRLGTRLGMSWSASSIATFIGPPIASMLLKKENGRTDFIGVQLWSGIFLLLGTVTLAVLWAMTVRKQKKGWKV